MSIVKKIAKGKYPASYLLICLLMVSFRRHCHCAELLSIGNKCHTAENNLLHVQRNGLETILMMKFHLKTSVPSTFLADFNSSTDRLCTHSHTPCKEAMNGYVSHWDSN